MDIKNLEGTPFAVIISMHINNFLITYGEDSIYTLRYLVDQSDGILELLDDTVGTARGLDESHAGVRLIRSLRVSYPDVDLYRIINELYKEVG